MYPLFMNLPKCCGPSGYLDDQGFVHCPSPGLLVTVDSMGRMRPVVKTPESRGRKHVILVRGELDSFPSPLALPSPMVSVKSRKLPPMTNFSREEDECSSTSSTETVSSTDTFFSATSQIEDEIEDEFSSGPQTVLGTSERLRQRSVSKHVQEERFPVGRGASEKKISPPPLDFRKPPRSPMSLWREVKISLDF